MKKIELTKGKVALVDDEDFEFLSQWKWFTHSTGGGVRNEPLPVYISRSKRQKTIFMHRVIMNCPEDMVVDHLDHNRFNNQKSNLRICIQNNNMKNRKLNINNTSGYKGVILEKRTGKWVATIQANKRGKYLGSFETPEDAAKAYDTAAKELHGEFAHLNFPDTVSK